MMQSASEGAARTLIFSQRNLNRLMYQCFIYEFEDSVASVEPVDILDPVSAYGSSQRVMLHRLGNGARRTAGLLPASDIRTIEVKQDYELFFSVFQFAHQLVYLQSLKNWRKRCGRAACFIAELWTPTFLQIRQYLDLLSDFDVIFTQSEVSAAALSAYLGRRCYCLPFGVDARRFCPLPEPAPRTIDVLSVGRYSPGTHQSLMRLAAEEGLFYHFDTGGEFEVKDRVDHRIMFAELVKRSKYFLTYKHNVNLTHLTGGDESLAPRFFEGAAGGAVLLGLPPECPEYKACFDWPDAVIPVPCDAQNMREVLADLGTQPDRLDAARKNNIANCIGRHDWAHRWARVLQLAGLQQHAGLQARLEKLQELANQISVPRRLQVIETRATPR